MTLVMKRGKKVEDNRLNLLDRKVPRDLEGKSYKYLGVLEKDKMQIEEMRARDIKQYYKRIQKLLESGLNEGDIIKAVNMWAVAAVRSTTRIVDWTVDKLKVLDMKARKLMTMSRAVNPKADVDRPFFMRERGRGMVSV